MTAKKIKPKNKPVSQDPIQDKDKKIDPESWFINFFETRIRPRWRMGVWIILIVLLLVVVVFRFQQSRHEELLNAYLRLDSATEAEELKMLASDNPDSEIAAISLLRSGRMFMKNENAEEAISVYEKILKNEQYSRYHQSARTGLAYAYETNGKHERALENFRALTELPDQDKVTLAAAWCGVGRNYLAMNREDRAHSAFERVVELAENSPYASQARQLMKNTKLVKPDA